MHTQLFTEPIMHSIHERVTTHFGSLAEISLLSEDQYFWNLCESIIGQQLSEKVAPQIVARVRAVLKEDLRPENVLATPDDTLRAAGLSYSKISYLKNVARFWDESSILPKDFSQMENEDLIVHLTQIKGVGRWTVEMFLIFTLGKPDVFSPGDYGLRRAILREYKLPDTTSPKEMAALAEQWSPHRSLASRLLWKSLEL
jgi:DNA-3-methyladenine glycosylase II